jgi:hypothetical protein
MCTPVGQKRAVSVVGSSAPALRIEDVNVRWELCDKLGCHRCGVLQSCCNPYILTSISPAAGSFGAAARALMM